MDTTTTKTCQIWPDFPVSSHFLPPEQLATLVRGSHRAGGDYIITFDAENYLNDQTDPVSDRVRAKLTTMLIEMRRQGQDCPKVTPELVMAAQNTANMSLHERANRLLVFLGEKTEKVGQLIAPIRTPPHPHTPLQMGAKAMSESVDDSEVEFLIMSLSRSDFVAVQSNRPDFPLNVTVPGFQRIAELTSANTDSAQAFVAMWFDPSINEVYENAIRPAIEEAGYDPFIINRHDFTGKIDDEIIAQIRQSRFLVADFTHAPDATVRGSVYYEAGFAHGLNIPVVFTARDGSDLHFDTAHYNHIMWRHDDLPKLRKGLCDRILAVAELGQGPKGVQ